MLGSKPAPAEWKQLRDTVAGLYGEGRSLAQIRDVLESEHGFNVSPKQLEYRLKRWGLRRNLKKSEYQYIQQNILERSQTGKLTGISVSLGEIPIPVKKLKRNISRYPPTLENSQAPGSHDGIRIYSPPRGPSSTSDLNSICSDRDMPARPKSSSGTLYGYLCWPYLSHIAHIFLFSITMPTFIAAAEASIASVICNISDFLPQPRGHSYNKITEASQGITITYRMKSSIFRAVESFILLICWGSHDKYRDILISDPAEELLHAILNPMGINKARFIFARTRLKSFIKFTSIYTNSRTTKVSELNADRLLSQNYDSVGMNERGKRTLSTGEPETPNGGKRLRLTGSRNVLSKFACPYAKADPDKNFLCWNINRKNVPGIKEHLKRLHWEGNLPPGIQLSRTWDDIFDYCFPDWGPQPRPSPYVNMFEIASKIQESKDELPANPPPERSNMVLESTSDGRRQASEYMRENSMEIRPAASSALDPSALNKSGITSAPESEKEAPRVTLGDRLKAVTGTPLFLDSGSNTSRDGHIETRLVYPTPTPSSRYSTPANFPLGNYQPSTTSGPDTGIDPNRGVPNTTIEHSNYSDFKNEEYQLIVRRYPINPSSSEPRGLRRFSFNSLDEFPANFEIWLKEQFTDPQFNWDHWELMVPESRCRLSSVSDVRDELDFQYAAYRSFKAALYLVAKERSSTDRAW